MNSQTPTFLAELAPERKKNIAPRICRSHCEERSNLHALKKTFNEGLPNEMRRLLRRRLRFAPPVITPHNDTSMISLANETFETGSGLSLLKDR